MAKKVAHSGGRGKHKKVDRLTRAERREGLVQRQEVWTQQWVGLVRGLAEAVLKSEIQELLGRPGGKWGDRSEQVAVRASCNKCQRKWRSWFRRNGSYPRSLVIEGGVLELRAPRLRCACGGVVDLSFSLFAPYERISPELAERFREAVALGLTLRQVGQVTAPANGGPLAKSTINTRILEVNRLVDALRQALLARIPPVVLVDGIWLKVLEPTGERFRDAKGRDRPRMRRKQVGLLVAYGVDPRTGEWWVLDWERAEQEDEASWGRLLERLRQRGLTAERGLRLIVSDGSDGLKAALRLVDLGEGVKHQLCVFHRLRNIGKAVKGVLTAVTAGQEAKALKEARRKRRQEVVKEAATIYQGANREEILRRRDEFVAKWREQEPEAVATLLRDFEQTIVYVQVQAAAESWGEHWDVRYLRTTSALERLNRRLRQMMRQVILLHSDRGLDVRVYLVLLQAGELLIPKGEDWLQWLEQELAAA
jgi:transposase-like protein